MGLADLKRQRVAGCLGFDRDIRGRFVTRHRPYDKYLPASLTQGDAICSLSRLSPTAASIASLAQVGVPCGPKWTVLAPSKTLACRNPDSDIGLYPTTPRRSDDR